MPRVKKKKEPVQNDRAPSNLPLIFIFILLLIQTLFLFYKNRDLVREMFRPDPNLIYVSGTEEESREQVRTIDPRNVRVSILNGCGVSGMASTWKDMLRAMEFDVRETGNARRRYEETIILSRTSDMSIAGYVAEKLGVHPENVLMQLNRDLVDIDITVIVGADYRKFDR